MFSYILRAGDINELVVPMLYFMYEGRKDPSKIGETKTNCTLVQVIDRACRPHPYLYFHSPASIGREEFLRQLERVLPQEVACNHADLLYIVIHKLMTDGCFDENPMSFDVVLRDSTLSCAIRPAGPHKLDTLYDCFLTTMSNVSPYIKTFCMPAALRATNLFEMFSKKSKLLTNEQYPRSLNSPTCAISPHCFEQILRRKKVFAELSEIMEGTGIDEILNKESTPAQVDPCLVLDLPVLKLLSGG
eukprot:472513-Hanusia_phi.AAC.3